MSSQEVTEEIEAQSGRSEFLKQALTLGLAGLAGTAAIFTDPTKIPSEQVAIGAVCAIGLSLLALVGCSLMGLSVYANLLKAHAANEAVTEFRTSMVVHARLVFVCIITAALGFVAYAGLQIAHRGDQRITAIEAIAMSRKAMASAGCEALFEAIERPGTAFQVKFSSDACRRNFVVTIGTTDGTVTIQSSR